MQYAGEHESFKTKSSPNIQVYTRAVHVNLLWSFINLFYTCKEEPLRNDVWINIQLNQCKET